MVYRYVWKTVLPYLLIAWAILSTILFLQQGSRFSDILFNSFVPAGLLFELGAALMLTITAFTAPLALLTAVVVGVGQLRADSEIIALYAAGKSRLSLIAPCVWLGLLISLVALLVNIFGVPFAARSIRRVAAEAALAKLESPIEPGVFNTEFKNYVIYVKEGNNERGIWEKVFIYLPEPDQIKLITAKIGRIDASADKSELVLGEAIVTTLPARTANDAAVTIEKVNGLRVALDAGRRQLKERLDRVEKTADEMGLAELARVAQQTNRRDAREAELLWHRRLTLSSAPLFLSLLGAAVSLLYARGGKGAASLLALLIAVVYYLGIVSGEQLARAQVLPVWIGAWAANALALLIGWRLLFVSERGKSLSQKFFRRLFGGAARIQTTPIDLEPRRRLRSFRLGLLELDLIKSFALYFAAICTGLLLLFQLFTTFEVLRQVTNAPDGFNLLGKYLLLLSPLVLSQVAPTALMIAILITYAVKSRRNEAVVWVAAGHSVSTLLFPALVCAAFVGVAGWQWQERVLPFTNPRQDALRARIRGAGGVSQKQNRYWLALENGLICYTGVKGSDNVSVKDVAYYEFDQTHTHLKRLRKGEAATWRDSMISLEGAATNFLWTDQTVKIETGVDREIVYRSPENPFNNEVKPVDQSSAELAQVIETIESPAEKRRLTVALQQKRAAWLLPLVMIFFASPLVLSLKKQSLTRSLTTAVGLWLIFILTAAVFQRVGNEGILPAVIAVWAPLLLFSSLGWFFLARVVR